MNWLVQRPIAHRGLHTGQIIPENSYLSFKKAIEKNYAIELDVRMTKDKKIVVFHDKNLLRLCSNKRKIDSYNYKELNDKFLYNTNETIPLLSDILELINGRVPILVEIKNYGKVGEFETILSKILENYSGEFAVCSFNIHVITWFKKYRPSFVRGFIYGDLHKFQIKFSKLTFLYRLIKTRPDFVSLDYKLLDTMLPKFCRWYGKKFVCWTVDSKDKMQKASNIADNVIFENISA